MGDGGNGAGGAYDSIGDYGAEGGGGGELDLGTYAGSAPSDSAYVQHHTHTHPLCHTPPAHSTLRAAAVAVSHGPASWGF